MTLILRPASPNDAAVAAALLAVTNGDFGVEVLGLGRPELQLSALHQWFQEPGNRFSYQHTTIAEMQGVVVGLLLAFPGSKLAALERGCVRRLISIYGLWGALKMVWVNSSMAGNKEAENDEYLIAHLGVDKGFRRQGIAQGLLAKAEQDAHNMRLPKLVLDVEMNNTNAIALYRKSNFEEVNAVYYGKKSDKYKSPGYYKMSRNI